MRCLIKYYWMVYLLYVLDFWLRLRYVILRGPICDDYLTIDLYRFFYITKILFVMLYFYGYMLSYTLPRKLKKN